MPLHNRWARMAAAGFGLALILQPVLAQQPQPKEPEEIRRVIRIHDNGQEQTLEITQKDGKILLNGKPIEEASQADKALYEQFKEDEITVQDRKIRIFRDGNRNEDLIFESMPKRGYLQRDTIRVRSYRREGDDDTLFPGMDFEKHDTNVIGLGPLDVLSTRELEVLALLGQGLSAAEIAEVLHRSVKTINTHRESIGKKLKIDDRVKLAAGALRAGLRLTDAARARV